MIKKLICMLVVMLFIVGLPQGFLDASTQFEKSQSKSGSIPKSYVSHTPIRINSDSDFDTQFPGREISGYDINGTDIGYCIYVGNCSIPFTIKPDFAS